MTSLAAVAEHTPVMPRRPPGWLVLVCLVLAIAITADVHAGGWLTHEDHRIGLRMARWDVRDTTWPKLLLTVLVYFGQRGVVVVGASVILAWVSWRRRTVEPIVRLVVAVLAIAVMVYALKLGVGRNSPRGDELGEPAGSGASFPSGHMTNAIVLWGLVDSTMRQWPDPEWLQRVVSLGRWIAPVAVTVGMIALNYHWLSDMLAGAAFGVVILSVVLLPVWATLARPINARLALRSSATP